MSSLVRPINRTFSANLLDSYAQGRICPHAHVLKNKKRFSLLTVSTSITQSKWNNEACQKTSCKATVSFSKACVNDLLLNLQSLDQISALKSSSVFKASDLTDTKVLDHSITWNDELVNSVTSLIFGPRKYTEFSPQEKVLVDSYQYDFESTGGIVLPNTARDLEEQELRKFVQEQKRKEIY